MRRRSLLAAALIAPAFPAMSATQAKFTPEALAAAQAAGKPILLAVHADWCPVCATQKPIIDSQMQKPEFQDLVILTIDFDSQKAILKSLNVTKQSTLIAMHGKTERGRAVGITGVDAIRALMLNSRA